MNAHLAASLAVQDEIYDDMSEAIRSLDETVLNWTPNVPEANSIAALVRHTIASTDAWIARAINEPVTRDRDAEFRFKANAEELVSQVAAARKRLPEQFARLESIDPSEIRRYKRMSKPTESSLSVAWCIEHATAHAAEHWGQIQLNIQLSAAGSGSASAP